MTNNAQTSAATFDKALDLFFGHNPKYPLWILVALYMRKKGCLHIVENPCGINKDDNLIWGWDEGADLSYARISFRDEIVSRWEKDDIKSITITGDISSDEDLVNIVNAFKLASAPESGNSVLFNPLWEPNFLLEVASLLLSIDDEWFEHDYNINVDDIIFRLFAKENFRGQFVQPKELTSLASSLMCKNHQGYYPFKIYNPCCGVGSYITADAPFVDYVGEEIDPTIASIAQFRMKWFDYEDAVVRCADSANSDFDDYDALISTPPFSTGLKDTPNFAEIFIGKCLDKRIPGVLVLPAGFAFDHKYKNLRSQLIENDALEGVRQLPAGVFFPYSGVLTVVVVINPNKIDNKGKVTFLDATSFLNDKTRILSEESIKEAWKEPNVNKVIINNDVIAKAGYSFSVGNYIGLDIPVPDGSKIYELDEVGTFINDFTPIVLEDVPWATLSSFNNANLIKGYTAQEIAHGKTMPKALKLSSNCVLISAVGARGVLLNIDSANPVYTHKNNVGFIPNTDIILP